MKLNYDNNEQTRLHWPTIQLIMGQVDDFPSLIQLSYVTRLFNMMANRRALSMIEEQFPNFPIYSMW